MKRPVMHPFKTEAELCAVFIDWAKPQGWTAYAETEGWDILLVHGDGTQIGVQAKLKLNLDVICQAIENRWSADRDVGPDFRAVLVPWTGPGVAICNALGLEVFAWRGDRHSPPRADHYLFTSPLGRESWGAWHYWNPAQRHPLPEYVPDVAAGASAPSQLTKWKIGALKIAAVNEIRGYVTLADFRRYGIDHRRWRDSDWMKPVADEPGRFRVMADFPKRHPTVYPQVKADIAEELAPTLEAAS